MSLHCMIDLETLDTQPGAVILSIGAVLFSPTKPPHECIEDEFYCVVNKQSCLALNMSISDSTLNWWASMSMQARKVLTQAEDPNESVVLKEALTSLRRFLPDGVKVWSNGANFDQPLLDVAYNKIGQRVPWEHYNSRCHRTIVALHPNEKALRPETICAHNALEDAKWQAKHLVNVAQALGLKL